MRQYVIAASFDTETTNIQLGETPDTTRAFPVLYIVLDLRGCDIREYVPDDSAVSFMRTESEMIAYIDELVDWGIMEDCIPVMCAYNMMFDVQTLMYELAQRYEMNVAAQSSTHAYTIDLLVEGKPALRLWDTYYLEMRGLAAMGDTCGIAKAKGDWDYTLIRTPQTPLTDEELHYAARDVEVIPAYLRYLYESNEWLEEGMLGSRVLTKTSLVRQTGRLEVGRLRLRKKNRKRISVQKMMETLCRTELAKTYTQYALRKACFRGGLTFTAANYAGIVQRRVFSIDETSAHHAYINGHMLPIRFHGCSSYDLQSCIDRVCNTSLDDVLKYYEEPFGCAFHARIKYTNLRLKEGSVFEKMGVAILTEAKFKHVAQHSEWESESGQAAENEVRSRGWYDVALGAIFAFGKLMSADVAVVHLSELECWCVSQVYDYDSCDCVFGEITQEFAKPPDYVTLLSNLLFERKQAMKRITKNYHEGEPYQLNIPASIPPGIASRLKNGTMSDVDVQGYYNSAVKGQFNSIYGTQAQDVFKPTYVVDRSTGLLVVDRESSVSPENYTEHRKNVENKTVLYTYGLRIVGGSRLPLIIGMMLLDSAYGDKVRMLGGDTDSMKISCDEDISADDIIAALEPLHIAVRNAINKCMQRIRTNFPKYASDLEGVGEFEVEGEPYDLHMEAWNKARVSISNGKCHITCAGLSRPKGTYHIEHWLNDMIVRGRSPELLFPNAIGWGVRVDHKVCHHLERHQPLPTDIFDADVTDYLGNTYHVKTHEAVALYASDRMIGDTTQGTNERCVNYLKSIGRNINDNPRDLTVDDEGVPHLYELTDDGWEEL